MKPCRCGKSFPTARAFAAHQKGCSRQSTRPPTSAEPPPPAAPPPSLPRIAGYEPLPKRARPAFSPPSPAVAAAAPRPPLVPCPPNRSSSAEATSGTCTAVSGDGQPEPSDSRCQDKGPRWEEDMGGMDQQDFDMDVPGAIDGMMADRGGAQDEPDAAEDRGKSPTPRRRSPSPIIHPVHTIEIHYEDKTGFPSVIIEPTADNPRPSFFNCTPTLPPSDKPASPRSPEFGKHPWSPFPSLSHAHIAKAVVEYNMPGEQAKEVLACHFNPTVHSDSLQPMSHDQLIKLLDKYDDNPFICYDLEHVENGKTYSAKHYQRKLRPIIEHLVADVRAARWIRWGAEKWYVWLENGEKERVYGEFTSGDCAWEMSETLGSGEYALFMTLFIDAANATNFAGSASIYPVTWWTGSVSQQGRVAGSLGGVQLLAFLPILPASMLADVPGVASDRIKASIDKQARLILIKAISRLMFVGLIVSDPLGIERRIRPLLGCQALDYQEAAKSFYLRQNHACVPCYEPLKDWGNLLGPPSRLRTPANMEEVYEEIREAGPRESDKELVRKKYGVHGDEQTPWATLPNNYNPYSSRSLDTLHENDNGLWGSHVRKIALEEIQRYQAQGLKFLAARYKEHPHFPELRSLRTKDAAKTSFADGNTNRDYLKLAPIYHLHLLPDEVAIILLPLMRAIALRRTILGGKAIAESRIRLLAEILNTVGEKCKELTAYDRRRFDEPGQPDWPGAKWYRKSPQEWRWPKFHILKHDLQTIRYLAAPTHRDTRQGEGEHVRLKKLYRSTNKQEVEGQMVKAYNRSVTYSRIVNNINNAYPGINDDDELLHFAPKPVPSQLYDPLPDSRYATVSSVLAALPQSYPSPRKFEERLRIFVRDWIENNGATHHQAVNSISSFPNVRNLPFRPYSRLDVVHYTSGDFSWNRAILRHNETRNDAVLIRRDGDTIIGTVLGLFGLSYQSQTFPIALIRPFTPFPKRDIYGNIPLQAADSSDAIFIEVKHIERPALIQRIEVEVLVEEKGGKKGKAVQAPRVLEQFYLNDTVDIDIYYAFAEVPGAEETS